MRIRKGSQVEVWTQEAGSPVGAWRGGEVQWGNGHSYILRWHDGGPDSGRISRKSVRPRPPPAPVPTDLDAGDMVEVFDEEDCLWKCAEVQRAPVEGGRQFRVKVVGAPKVLTVAPNRLRVRQVLREDDVWVVLHKDNQIAGVSATPLRVNGNGNGGHPYKPVTPGFNPMKQKRPPSMFDAEAIPNGQRFDNTSKKLCVREEPKLEIEVIDVPTNVCLNKQDEIGSSSEDCDVVGTGSNSHDDNNQQPPQHHADDDDSESVSSSDASSNSDSSSSNSDDSRTRSDDAGDRAAAAPASVPHDDDQKAGLLQKFPKKEHRDDDIVVSCGSWGRPPLNDEKAVVQEQIHRLELEAYTALTRAFHATGDALSWEKADLLTDLRTHLNISNDEHLQVINAVMNRKGRRYGRPGNF
ncbi:hypothetical protein EJB05_16421 [Eragrostis curvula]|uniref:ENT domain-containing protein n=1 Tax=Eragrostis curvula TaxID=38414 RepID=A0A5J9VGR4_9POAL|nr:hypothetical protein EJB05_16421 [Eragrostis curvula]